MISKSYTLTYPITDYPTNGFYCDYPFVIGTSATETNQSVNHLFSLLDGDLSPDLQREVLVRDVAPRVALAVAVHQGVHRVEHGAEPAAGGVLRLD